MNLFRKKNKDELIDILTKVEERSDLWSKGCLGPKIRTQDRHNTVVVSKITAETRSTVFPKSVNPQKSTISAIQ